MKKINIDLLIKFLQVRKYYGVPTKIDILASISKTQTRTLTPPNWQWH
jgi:hypothetical protein